MDVARFDRLVRTLATVASRRQTLLAVLLGVASLALGTEEAEPGPGCKNVGHKCKKAK